MSRMRWTPDHVADVIRQYLSECVPPRIIGARIGITESAVISVLWRNKVLRSRSEAQQTFKSFRRKTTGYPSRHIDGKKVPLHRLTVEQALGRKLRSDEIVHHKDERRLNYDRDNLEVTTRAGHRRLHSRDLTGQRFGRYTVIGRAPSPPRRPRWWCRCDCGRVRDVRADTLVAGTSTQCRSCATRAIPRTSNSRRFLKRPAD